MFNYYEIIELTFLKKHQINQINFTFINRINTAEYVSNTIKKEVRLIPSIHEQHSFLCLPFDSYLLELEPPKPPHIK